MQDVLERVHAAFPDVLIAALHDDAEIAGPPDRVREALHMFLTEAAAVGLMPAGHKFTLYTPDDGAADGVQAEGILGGASRASAPLAAVMQLESLIDRWSDEAAVREGRGCRAQSV